MISNMEILLSKINAYNEEDSRIDIREYEPLSRHSTFKIGGTARVFSIPVDVESLIFLINECRAAGVRFYIIGNGSNVLFDDNGFDGVIISTSSFNEIKVDGAKIHAGSGAMLSACALKAKENSLTGMECLFGIPGTVGGAIYMNAGAYGGEMRDITVKTRYLNLDSLTISEVVGDEHRFGYRHSIFKDINAFIIDTELCLKEGNFTEITAAMDDFKQRRISKQPLDYPSAGSTFKRYPGRYTAQMIDELGLKGLSVGGAQVSEKHAGFIINKGNATSKDVLSLIDTVKSEIKKSFDIEIETEIIHVK